MPVAAVLAEHGGRVPHPAGRILGPVEREVGREDRSAHRVGPLQRVEQQVADHLDLAAGRRAVEQAGEGAAGRLEARRDDLLGWGQVPRVGQRAPDQ